MGLSGNGAMGLGGRADGFEVANQGVTKRAPGEGPKVNGGRTQSQEMDSYDQPQYEAQEYDQIPGGLAAGKSPEDFNQDALSKGIDVEMEHTTDPQVAVEIAMDHLTEDPEYYEKLAKMENEAHDPDEVQRSIDIANKVWGKPDPKNVNPKLKPLPPQKDEPQGMGPLPTFGDPLYWASEGKRMTKITLKEFFNFNEAPRGFSKGGYKWMKGSKPGEEDDTGNPREYEMDKQMDKVFGGPEERDPADDYLDEGDWWKELWDYAQNRYITSARELNDPRVMNAGKKAFSSGQSAMEFADDFFGRKNR